MTFAAYSDPDRDDDLTPVAGEVTAMTIQQLPMFGQVGAISKAGDEWYTPADIVAVARAVMGGIDLDPASSAAANQVVQASRYFTIADDGLRQPWHGRVWLNPPYSDPAPWIEKLIGEYERGHVSEAILLVPPDTDTRWFAPLFDYPICFKTGRIKFWGRKGDSNTQGSCFVYFGPAVGRFAAIFSSIGAVVCRWLPGETLGD